MKSLGEIINEPNYLPGKTQIDYEKAAAYQEALEILDTLVKKKQLTYTAADAREPIWFHTIQIQFNFDDNYCQEFEGKVISELLSKVDTLLIDSEPIAGHWQLGSTLYGLKD